MAAQDVFTGSTGDGQAVACTLGSTDLATQSKRWQGVLAASGVGRLETADGIRLRFRADDDVEQELRTLVAVENDCCVWAAWTVSAVGEELEVVVTSDGDGITALHGMFNQS